MGKVLNMDDYKFKNLPQIDMSKFSANIVPQAIANVGKEQERLIAQISKINQEKARQVAETQNNIRQIANSSTETNELLREQNSILKENNKLLSEKLKGINRTLDDLFNLTELTSSEQTELMREANDLAKQIEINIVKNGKFDIKDFAVNTSVTGLFMGLQVFLHNKGLL